MTETLSKRVPSTGLPRWTRAGHGGRPLAGVSGVGHLGLPTAALGRPGLAGGAVAAATGSVGTGVLGSDGATVVPASAGRAAVAADERGR